ncbi:MAG: hypothetical protein ABL876_00095 [Chitinophagaceae bacterium]
MNIAAPTDPRTRSLHVSYVIIDQETGIAYVEPVAADELDEALETIAYLYPHCTFVAMAVAG